MVTALITTRARKGSHSATGINDYGDALWRRSDVNPCEMCAAKSKVKKFVNLIKNAKRTPFPNLMEPPHFGPLKKAIDDISLRLRAYAHQKV